MEYDFRNQAGHSSFGSQPYGSFHRPTGSVPSSPLYPRVGPHGQPAIPSANRAPPYQHGATQSASPGTGIRIAIKPQFRITPPPQMPSYMGEIPRSNFQYDFEFEKKILAEAEKETQNWSQLAELVPPRIAEPTPSPSATSRVDPVMSKYLALGLNGEGVSRALSHYGDNPEKVKDFVEGYYLMQDMGFKPKDVAEVLFMYDNDRDKALGHLLGNSS